MTQRKSSAAGWLPGIILVAIGIGLLFNKALLFDTLRIVFRTLDNWWPMFYVALGLVWLLVWRPRRKVIPMLLVVGGVIAQIGELRIFPWWTWRQMWPLILVVMGAWLLYLRMRSPRPAPDAAEATSGTPKEISGEAVDSFVIFGGLERALTSQTFRGGEATAVFGGIDLDLRRARLAPGDQRMKLFALCGGIELVVPEDLPVVLQGTPILGSIEDSRKAEAPAAKEVTAADLAATPVTPPARLIIDGFAMFGGIEVKA